MNTGMGKIVIQQVTGMPMVWNWLRRAKKFTLLLPLFLSATTLPVAAQFAKVEPATSTNGYIARLLINEVPFPGDHAYESQTDSQACMYQILWVLHSRIYLIPPRYKQKWVSGVSSTDILDIITGTGGRRQCEGFYRDDQGNFITDPRVEVRLNRLLKIANSGGKPGRFAALINYAQGLATAYYVGGIEGADRFAGLTNIDSVAVTGHAYSWMTDIDDYHPGGNFVYIPTENDGSLGGNRFFTLRKIPK